MSASTKHPRHLLKRAQIDAENDDHARSVNVIRKMPDGYFWVRHHVDGSLFIVFFENGLCFMPGLGHPVLLDFDSILGFVKHYCDKSDLALH
jgi:hypothetical protein